MVLRLSSEAVIPTWQIALSLALLVVATALGIFVAGRVFRIGILWQRKSPKFTQLIRWALRGRWPPPSAPPAKRSQIHDRRSAGLVL
jgi:ABC-2 type transport system permease protein